MSQLSRFFFGQGLKELMRNALSCRKTCIAIAFFFTLLCAAPASGAELSNDTIRLTLGFTPSGVPVIERAEWLATGETIFVDPAPADSLDEWIPEKFIPEALAPASWRVKSGFLFPRGEATLALSNGLSMTWIIELAPTGSTFRLRVRLKNTSDAPLGVKWFPIWNGSWQMGDSLRRVNWWRPLTYEQNLNSFTRNESLTLGSRLHSSNSIDDGALPYWIAGGDQQRTFFALEWSGGWEAIIRGDDGALDFQVRLPPADTQLTLQPEEFIEGPRLWVTPTSGLDEAQSRHFWMAERRALAQRIFGGPEPSFPLTYNTWYAASWDVNRKFLRKQLEEIGPYEFDAFIVDAGWYEKPGQWDAAQTKFLPNELEEMLAGLQAQGILPGLWSTPQYTTPSAGLDIAAIEQPGFFNDVAGGYLIDLAGSDFKTQLKNHISFLRSQFSIGWWKYDQEVFVEDSRSGVMKNVAAFQKALLSARYANPTLMIENCQNGGRMINELTALTAQALWLRDGQLTGQEDARRNIESALGASDFLFPWLAYRFTKNFEALPPDNDEMTRLYCRSAMIGTWGISTDLRAVSEAQRQVILREIRFYRYLAPIKLNYLYELDKPAAGKEVVGVTFYDDERQHNGVLLYRWDSKQAFNHRLFLKQLDPSKFYRVRDADRRTRIMMSGAELIENGVEVCFPAERLSALLFVDVIE